MTGSVYRTAAPVLALITLVLASPSFAGPGHDHSHDKPKAQIDEPAPDFTLASIEGGKHSLSDYKGRFVVLEWNNFDCPFVRKHYSSGNMQALQETYGEKGVVWLTVLSSAPGKQGYYESDALAEMTAKKKWKAAAYLLDTDGAVGRAYGARTTPHMFVIDPDGVLIYGGAIDDKPSTKTADVEGATNYVSAALDAAMAGKDVGVKATTPYGCSVKYGE